LTQEELDVVVRAALGLLSLWELTSPEMERLLAVSQAVLERWAKDPSGSLLPETVDRMANIFAIHRTLENLLTGDEVYRWVRKRSAAFNGKSALDVMMTDGLGGIVRVRRYLEAELSG
jgi:hypothetical protein